MYKSIVIFVYFVSMALLTHQAPVQDQSSSNKSGYMLCPKGEKRCGDQCYHPEKYVCLPPDEHGINTVTTQTLAPSTPTKTSTTSTIAPRTSPAIVKATDPEKKERFCRLKQGIKGQKECKCGDELYNPRTHKCHNGQTVCRKSNKNCRDKDVTKNAAAGALAEAGIEVGAKAGADLIEIGTTQLKQFISNINEVSEKRDEFTEKTIQHFEEVTNHKKNILVIDNKWPNQVSVGESYVKAHVEVPKPVSGTHGFDIYIFDEGVVTKHGDGGFINWRYSGNTELIDGDSKRVRFNKIE